MAANGLIGINSFLYATLRNTRPGSARNVYAEVAVYIANASTGLSWPTDFTMLPQSRQFLTLHLEPGQVTDIGPLPWTPPAPTTSDHWCIYIRVLSVQEASLVEGSDVGTNVANSNSIAWRNLKIVAPDARAKVSKFIVRNIQAAEERLALHFDVAPALFQNARLTVQLDETLQRAFQAGEGKVDGLRMTEQGAFIVTSAQARIDGLRLAARQQGGATIRLDADAVMTAEGDVQVTQISSKGVDGGVTLCVARRGTSDEPQTGCVHSP